MSDPGVVFEFTKSGFVKLNVLPDWLNDAALAEKEHEDRNRSLSDEGAEMIENYGMMGETLDVWRREGSGWLVEWWDIDSHIMSIVVTSIIDYATLQATWVCPMVMKIIAADDYIRANEERRFDAEKATATIN